MWNEELPDPQDDLGLPEANSDFGSADFDFSEAEGDGFGDNGSEDGGLVNSPAARPTPQRTARQTLPNVVSLGDLYQAAYARARADHELTKLFNPDYDI